MIDPRIEQAASFLDQQDKDWFTRIDTNAIDMNDTQWCILGQAFGDWYGSGFAFNSEDDYIWAFYVGSVESDWIEAIENRRNGVNAFDGPGITLDDLEPV